jgi:phage baseplate assembly protein V
MVNLKNLIRIGTVSSVNYKEGKLRVCFEDQDKIVTDELPMLSFEYEMPDVGEPVLCLFLGNGITNGFCLGRYYYDGDPPMQWGQNIYFKRFLKDATQRYDSTAKTMTFTANKFVFNGDVTIHGNLVVSGSINAGGDIDSGGNMNASGNITAGGNINAGGSIIDTSGNTNHHSHP